MITVTSKNVVALRNSPRINEQPFEDLQEWLSGVHPLSPIRKTHDSGKPREVFPDLSPAGPNEITREKEDRSSMSGVSSGYNRGMDPGGRADDETGPGNTSIRNDEQTNKTHDVSELAFKNDFDLSSKFSPLNFVSNAIDQGRTQDSTNHLTTLLYERPKIPSRVPVDTMSRSRAANSNWNHIYV